MEPNGAAFALVPRQVAPHGGCRGGGGGEGEGGGGAGILAFVIFLFSLQVEITATGGKTAPAGRQVQAGAEAASQKPEEKGRKRAPSGKRLGCGRSSRACSLSAKPSSFRNSKFERGRLWLWLLRPLLIQTHRKSPARKVKTGAFSGMVSLLPREQVA